MLPSKGKSQLISAKYCSSKSQDAEDSYNPYESLLAITRHLPTITRREATPPSPSSECDFIVRTAPHEEDSANHVQPEPAGSPEQEHPPASSYVPRSQSYVYAAKSPTEPVAPTIINGHCLRDDTDTLIDISTPPAISMPPPPLPSAASATPAAGAEEHALRSEHVLNVVGSEYMRVIGVQKHKKFLSSRIGAEHDGDLRVVHENDVSSPSDQTGGQLTLRKELYVRRTHVSDYAAFVGVLGVCLAVIDAELRANEVMENTHPISLCLRTACLATTVALIGFIFAFHSIELELAKIDTGVDAWFLVISQKRICQIFLETLICAFTPLPGTGYVRTNSVLTDISLLSITETHTVGHNGEARTSWSERNLLVVNTPMDTLLTIPMFLRCYLVGRFMVLHSQQFRDSGTRMIAALNRVSVDFAFVLKSAILKSPAKVLVIFALSYWVTVSWMFYHCERHTWKALHLNESYSTAVWFIVVTFLTVGYGDVVPNTLCGRTISVCTGIMGLAVSSALIAVVTRSLELSNAEKHVNAFMADSKLGRKKKDVAARILQEMWYIYKYRCLEKSKEVLKVRIHQRRFLIAIEEFRQVKWEQRRLVEQTNELTDALKIQQDTFTIVNDIQEQQKQFAQGLQKVTERLGELQFVVGIIATQISLSPPALLAEHRQPKSASSSHQLLDVV